MLLMIKSKSGWTLGAYRGLRCAWDDNSKCKIDKGIRVFVTASAKVSRGAGATPPAILRLYEATGLVKDTGPEEKTNLCIQEPYL